MRLPDWRVSATLQFLGGREYAMRIWLDPDKVAANNLDASRGCSTAICAPRNLQVSAGILKPARPTAGERGVSGQRRGTWQAVYRLSNLPTSS